MGGLINTPATEYYFNPDTFELNNNTFPASNEPGVFRTSASPYTTANQSVTNNDVSIGKLFSTLETTKPEPLSTTKTDDKSSGWGVLGEIGGGIMGSAKGIAALSNAALGWASYAENRKLIKKQIDNINEQIAASQEYRQQRRDEIARLNRVRNNTQKAFNTGTTITRSY